MLASPVPADPGWDDDLAWLDRDPVTGARGVAGPAVRAGRGHREDEADEYGDVEPFTAEELAEIRRGGRR